jgi:sugar phosphate isomerase/epimerase
MIREAVAYAADRGIILNIENHYKDGYWEYPEFALRSEIFLEIIDQIDSPFLGINFDPSNAIVAGEDPIALLERIKERVVTMHASDRYLEGGMIEDLRKWSSTRFMLWAINYQALLGRF